MNLFAEYSSWDAFERVDGTVEGAAEEAKEAGEAGVIARASVYFEGD